MRDIINIEFIFENCESVKIPAEYFGTFSMDNIHRKISRIASNAVSDYLICDTFVCEIFSNANKEYCSFGIEEYKTNIFDRILNFNDITGVCVEYSENKDDYETFFVDWAEDNDYDNAYQKKMISDLGHLYIVIDKEKDIKDFFDMEEINNKEEVDFRYEMVFGIQDRIKKEKIDKENADISN